MIGWLSGQIIDKHHPGKLVINVNGIGYDVETSLPTFFQLEKENAAVHLHIHTVVREDALLLYGFANQEERALFRALIKVNGVGPKSAIAILSSIQPQDFIQCIQDENISVLTRLPGIGKKTAERLVVEMKDSLKDFTLKPNLTASIDKKNPHYNEAIQALEALGFKTQEATRTIQMLDDPTLSCEQLIRKGLQILSR